MDINNTTLVYLSLETDYTFTDSTIVTDLIITQTTEKIGTASAEVITQTLRLGTSEVVTIYASVIGGILGFFLVAAVACWLLEQSERISDPIGENIRNILDKPPREISEWSETPPSDIHPQGGVDLPGWMRPRLKSNAFEMQETAVPINHYDETCDENLYESYDESAHRDLNSSRRSYGYINTIATAENLHLRASVKSTAHLRNNPLVQEMKNKFQDSNAPGSTRRQSSRLHAYETRLELIEDAYNQSIYSNDEITAEIPRRGLK